MLPKQGYVTIPTLFPTKCRNSCISISFYMLLRQNLVRMKRLELPYSEWRSEALALVLHPQIKFEPPRYWTEFWSLRGTCFTLKLAAHIKTGGDGGNRTRMCQTFFPHFVTCFSNNVCLSSSINSLAKWFSDYPIFMNPLQPKTSKPHDWRLG